MIHSAYDNLVSILIKVICFMITVTICPIQLLQQGLNLSLHECGGLQHEASCQVLEGNHVNSVRASHPCTSHNERLSEKPIILTSQGGRVGCENSKGVVSEMQASSMAGKADVPGIS